MLTAFMAGKGVPAHFDLGQRLKAARVKAGFDRQEDLTAKVGWAQSTLSAWEKGRVRPDIGNRILFAAVCNLPITEFLEESERDLLRHTGTGPSASHASQRDKDGHTDAATAGLLKERAETSAALLDIYNSVLQLLIDRGDVSKTDGIEHPQTRQRRRARTSRR